MTDLDDKASDLAHENAELRRQLNEALVQQAATAEILEVINSSSGNFAPVFDAMLEGAMHICGAAFCAMAVFENGPWRSVATCGVPSAKSRPVRHL